MSKKKRFGISEALTRGLSETINVVENNTGLFRHVILPLSRIELDPDNPRKLAISIDDVRQGLKSNDLAYQRKQAELEKLKELAHTIRTSGVINPIVVYKRGEHYRVVAGERRCLASILASKQEIEARVFNEKPKGFELKLVQWIENTAREDLSLGERLDNVADILKEYQREQGSVDVNATLLKNITGLSLSQCSYYLLALKAPADLRENIHKGHIKNLDKAALIASVSAADLRARMIDACANGMSLKDLRNMVSSHKATNKIVHQLKQESRGRSTSKIQMGSTDKAEVVKILVHSVVSQKKFDKHIELFSGINWTDIRQAAKAFRKLVEILETEMAV